MAYLVGSQWLHANLMAPVMALPLARSCPHELAPSGHGKDRGFMMRIIFPLNEKDAPYPPGGAPEGPLTPPAAAYVLPPTGTNDSTLNCQAGGDPGPFRGRYCAEMCY